MIRQVLQHLVRSNEHRERSAEYYLIRRLRVKSIEFGYELRILMGDRNDAIYDRFHLAVKGSPSRRRCRYRCPKVQFGVAWHLAPVMVSPLPVEKRQDYRIH